MMKTKRLKLWIPSIVALFLATLLSGCKDEKLGIVGLCPIVVSTVPANLATNVPLNQVITATFNEKMNPATITDASFTLTGATPITGTITYSGLTATFTPSSPLPPSTKLTGVVKRSVKDLMGNLPTADYVWTFTTEASPTVFTDPANLATEVPLTKVVTAIFSIPMDPLTINATTFTIKQGTTLIPGAFSYLGSTASFTPTSALTPNTLYTGTITTGAKTVLGTPMTNNYVWTFTTSVPPSVITDPVNKATGVILNKIVTATFSVPMDPTSLTATTFTIKQGTTPVVGTVTYSGSTATFVHALAFAPNTVYTGTISAGAKNALGTPLGADYVWTFTTGISPTLTTDPANNATNVVLNKVVTASYSVPMDPSTINGTTFTLANGTTPVDGTVTFIGTTASFTPTVNLLPGTQYTGTITAGTKSLAGIPLAVDYVWKFTTGAVPIVNFIDPLNLATSVAVNKVVSARFSLLMDPLSINGTTFTLTQGTPAVAVLGTVNYDGTTASFVSTTNLLPGTQYTATITAGAKSMIGIPMAADYVWTFTTVAAIAPTVIATDPANNSTGVALNKTVSATFSMPMDRTTLVSPATTFTLAKGTTSVPGTVSYTSTTAYFVPTTNLSPSTQYTATITTAAKSTQGTPMANNYVWSFTTVAASAYPIAPDLKTSGRFGILAGVGVSNDAGFSVINNLDVGISPGSRSSVTGFPPATIVNGAIYAADDGGAVAAMLTQAKQDLTDAYLFAEGASSPAPVTVAGDQGGKTLAPGIYKSTSTLLIQNGDLTLDAQGDANAVWIFQVAAGFTTVGGAGGNVILSGGAQAKNIYWQVGSSATIGDNTSFKGNILALTTITMNSNATAVGRMLARNGAVTMTSTNTINKP
jgi:hypothetical protein